MSLCVAEAALQGLMRSNGYLFDVQFEGEEGPLGRDKPLHSSRGVPLMGLAARGVRKCAGGRCEGRCPRDVEQSPPTSRVRVSKFPDLLPE